MALERDEPEEHSAEGLAERARACESDGRAEEAARAWSLAAAAASGSERAEALLHQAEVVGGALGRADDAVALLRRALLNDPQHPETLAALAERAEEEGDWLRLGLIEARRFDAAESGAERAEIALRLAELEGKRLCNAAGARAWLVRGLKETPGNLELHEALAELERERGQPDALLERLEEVVRLRHDRASASLLVEAATLHARRGAGHRALSYLHRAAAQEPENLAVFDALAEQLAALERHTDLANVLERRAALSDEGPARAAVLAELGTLYEDRLFDADAAIESFERAHELDPSCADYRQTLERLREKLDASGDGRPATGPEAAIAAYEREALLTSDRDRLGVIVREIEHLYTRCGNPDGALPWVQRWVVAAPEDPDALRTLARLYDRPDHEAPLIATLEALDPLLEPAAQIDNRRRIAALHLSGERFAEAESAYARALALDPTDRSALEGRAEALRVLNQPDALVEVLTRLAERTQGSQQRLELQREIARTHELGGDLAAAIASLETAESEHEFGDELSDQLDDLLARSLRHEERVSRLARRSDRAGAGSAEAVGFDLQRAALLLDPLERSEEAAALYRAVLEHAPESREARAGLERALRSSVDAAGLAEFLSNQIANSDDPRQRDRHRFERGVLLEELLDEPEEALEVFEALATESAVDEVGSEAGERAERLYERLGRWSALRDYLQRCLGRHSGAEDARLHERLAEISAVHLSDDDAELRHLERVVELDPNRADVWQLLAGRYSQDGRIEEWTRALEAELGCDPDHARELGLRARLAHLYVERLDQPERALLHYERVFELDPAHSAAADSLVEEYERSGRFEAVVGVLEARLAALGARAEDDSDALDQRTSLRLQIARVRGSQLDDVEGAISALEVALEEVGPTATIAEPLADAYQQAGYRDDLIDLCARAAAATNDPSERANWWVRLGDTHLAREEPREAAEHYRRALTDRPGDRAVEATLRELYRSLGRVGPLAELLESELARLAGMSEVPVRLELIELLRSARPEDALRHARRLLELVPRHVPAGAAALELAIQLEQPEAALAVLDQRLASAESAHERSIAETERARLLAGPLARPDEAVAAYRRALGCCPTGSRARELRNELTALLERDERWSEWLDCVALTVLEGPEEERAALIERASMVAWDRISPEAALPWLERLRRLRPDDAALRSRISLALRELGREAELLRALAAEARVATDLAQRRRCLFERATLLRAAGQAGRALAVLAEIGPNPEALATRDEIQREMGLHAERATTLEARIALGASPLELRRELAELYAGPLASPDTALRCWRNALDVAPESGTARTEILRSIAETERRVGRLDEWARWSERELASLDGAPVFDDRRRELRRELAIAYEQELARPDVALEHIRALLDADDADLLGSDMLDRLECSGLALLRTSGNAIELATRLARRLERVEGRAAEWLELAQLREEILHRPAAALEAYRSALELEPTSLDAVRGLRRCAQRLGRFPDVADALERELEHHASDEDATHRGALLRGLGDLYWHRLGSTTKASRCYGAALEANGSDFAALRALERLLEDMEDWQGALDLYGSEVSALGDANPKRRREIWLRVASIARERAGEPERARRALERAAAIEALDASRLAELAALHEDAGDLEAFVECLTQWCDDEQSGAGAAEQRRLARALEALERPEDALERIELSLRMDPDPTETWDDAARLRALAGDPAGSAKALCRAVEFLDEGEALPRLIEAAEALEASDPDSARMLLERASALRPDDAAAQAALARVCARCGRDEEAERAAEIALERGSDGSLDDAALAAAARCGAEAARRRGRDEAAAGFYSDALRLDPDDSSALARHGEILLSLGDTQGARTLLERRLAVGDAYPERAEHRAMLGRCLESAGEPEEALCQFEAALSDDPEHATALEASVWVLESLDRIDPGVAAIERWARRASGPERASRLLRAAEWELRRGERAASAEAHLRAALAADPELAPAWVALTRLCLESGRPDDAIECADRAAATVESQDHFAELAMLQAQAFEQRGERREAAEHFGIAAECDSRAVNAALAQARLLRGFGEWREAGAALARFAEHHPGDDDDAQAEIYEQLGRLRAGPLEDVDGAVLCYRRAIELAPDRLDARAALAELLSHRPGDWDESLEHLRSVLALRPTHAACLRVALRVARGRGDAALLATGSAIQRALGIASAYEGETESADAAPFVTCPPALSDERFETLRLLTVEAAPEIAGALEAGSPVDFESDCEDPIAAFRQRMLGVQGELSTPALLAHRGAELRDCLSLLVQLVLEPEQVHGDGALVNALGTSLGRRRRRKLRKLLGDATSSSDFDALDYDAWEIEMRALAAAETLRRDGGSLRTACLALADEPADRSEPGAGAHLAPRIEADPVARAFLCRVVTDWLGRL